MVKTVRKSELLFWISTFVFSLFNIVSLICFVYYPSVFFPHTEYISSGQFGESDIGFGSEHNSIIVLNSYERQNYHSFYNGPGSAGIKW